MSDSTLPFDIEQHLYEHAIRSPIRAPMRDRLLNLTHNRMVTMGAVAMMGLCAAFSMIGGNFAGPASPANSARELTGRQSDTPQPAPDVNAVSDDQPRQMAAMVSGF
jgi:hypothetical protein